MSNLKLGVEVVSAFDLMPEDEQDSTINALVELHFDGQKFQTTTKDEDLDPVWNESIYFNVCDPNNLSNLTLYAYVYNQNKTTNSKFFLGKVCLDKTSFVPYSEAVVFHYPLEEYDTSSHVQGELGLKVFVINDPPIESSNPLPAMESSPHMDSSLTEPQQLAGALYSESGPQVSSDGEAEETLVLQESSDDEAAERHTFHHLPNPNLDSSPAETQPTTNYGAHEMKSEPQADYEIKETSPFLGVGQVVGGRVIRGDHRQRQAITYDLVEQIQYLFVQVVKSRDLPSMDLTGSLDPFVEVKVGNYKGVTKFYEKERNPEWDEVFAFEQDRLQSSVLEVVVKDKDFIKDSFVGVVWFDLNEVLTRVPHDTPLAPQWYRLEDRRGNKIKGELMLAVWYSTQADEAFSGAWTSDSIMHTGSSSNVLRHMRSKVYHSPRLWYLRVNVIEAQDLVVSDKNRLPDAYVKVQIGNQILITKPMQVRTLNPVWNEDLMFIAAEPLEDLLILSVEDRVDTNEDKTIGKVIIPVNSFEKRADDRIVRSRWYNLEKPMSMWKAEFSSKILLRVSLDGGYHVLEESTHYSTDLRPTAKQLWKPSIGVLEIGILNANGLHPMKIRDGKGTSDTYCVAKYGHKWVRTRTIIGSLSPRYNEQYTWEVYDPATVITVGVFDSGLGSSSGMKDVRIGKVRIRISTLQTGRVYTHSYPLLVLNPSGVKKMGELHLAIRFSCTSFTNMMFLYSRPLLPKMHYVRPLTTVQLDMLRYQAVNIVASRLSRAEPPLGKEVVEYMSDVDCHLWSMRRSKANFFRLMSVISGLFTFVKWFGEVRMWRNSITTILVHVFFVMVVYFSELIVPTVFLCMFLSGIWSYRNRPGHPPHMNIRISQADSVHPDELDEEFDTFPTSRSSNIVRMRYDRLRTIAGRLQNVAGDVATQGERIQALLSWHDPRATIIFVIFCLLVAIVMYVTSLKVFVLLAGFYIMRHPKLRHRTPSSPINFFRRLPSRMDNML